MSLFSSLKQRIGKKKPEDPLYVFVTKTSDKEKRKVLKRILDQANKDQKALFDQT